MSPRRKVEKLDVDSEFSQSAVLKVRLGVEEILGGDLHVHLVAEPRLNPGRMAQVMTGRPRFRPLRWSDLDPKIKKQIENFVPFYGNEDFIKYGDTVLMVCPKAEWEAELKRKNHAAMVAYSPKAAEAQFARETGLPVDTKWEEVSDKYAPRSVT